MIQANFNAVKQNAHSNYADYRQLSNSNSFINKEFSTYHESENKRKAVGH